MTSEVYISSSSGEAQVLTRSTKLKYRFALINGGSDFFLPVQSGWDNRCRELNVNCLYFKSVQDDLCASFQKGVLEDLAAAKLGNMTHNFTQPNSNVVVDGVAMAPCDSDQIGNISKLFIEEAGIPLITFDQEIPGSPISAYVGTDNDFMGVTMANVVKQLRPAGGTFAIVTALAKPNVIAREEGFRREMMKDNHREGKAKWYEIKDSPKDGVTLNTSDMDVLTEQNPTALAVMYQTPMRSENWTAFIDSNRFRNISIVATDASDYQIDYLNRRYVDGLVGQLPYDFGAVSADVLMDLVHRGGTLPKYFYATNLVSYTLIPLELPPVTLDENLLGNLVIMGYFAVAMVIGTALACIGWTAMYRKDFVVRAAQPFFLIMVATGVIILSSALIPLSFDDDGDIESVEDSARVAMCMSIPWLAFTGFAVTFSALFSKTWRVNRLFRNKIRHARVQVKVKDVLAPFAVLLSSNIIVLICWTVIDPLTYSREENDGLDYWNRVISTYGTCRSDNVAAYLIPLAVINFAVVCTAVWQAYQARTIQSEFAETKYIGLALSSIFQGFLTGVPILVIVKDDPQAFYVVLTLMIFLLCMAVLLLIFLPKYFMHKKYSGLPEAEQRRLIAEGIRKSSGAVPRSHGDSRSGFGTGGSGSGGKGDGSGVVEMSDELYRPTHPIPKKVIPSSLNQRSILSDDRQAIHDNSTASNDLVLSNSRNAVSSITVESRFSDVEHAAPPFESIIEEEPSAASDMESKGISDAAAAAAVAVAVAVSSAEGDAARPPSSAMEEDMNSSNTVTA